MKDSLKALRKILVFLVGITVVIVGIILLAVPGPGLLVIIAGLLILSLEFDWAKRYLHQARQRLHDMNQSIKSKKSKQSSTKDVDRTGNHQRKRKG